MFRTDLLPIIRSLNTVFTGIGTCHTSYVDCLLATPVFRLLMMDSKSPKHVELFNNIKLRNSAYYCFL
jgi:hypothetical protein